jgi:hypothetical protein
MSPRAGSNELLSENGRETPQDMAAVALPPASSATAGATFPPKTGEPIARSMKILRKLCASPGCVVELWDVCYNCAKLCVNQVGTRVEQEASSMSPQVKR